MLYLPEPSLRAFHCCGHAVLNKQGNAVKSTSLAAVFYSQIAGFELLLQDDNHRAIRVLSAYQKMVRELLPEHNGEIVDCTGDEFLIIFNSAVHAVQCALHLELAVNGHNQACEEPADRYLLCVGIHLGEIWRDENHVYGNGINIGARVKQAAAPGMILVSEDVERQVSNKLDIVFTELPECQLKNIERPLRLYAIGDSSRVSSSLDSQEATTIPVSAVPTPLPPLQPLSHAQPVQNPVAPAATHEELRTVLRDSIRASVLKSIESATAARQEAVASQLAAVSQGPKSRPSGGAKPPQRFATSEPGRAKVLANRELASVQLGKAKQARNAALLKILLSALSGSLLAWAYIRTESAWVFMAAAVFGLLPLLNGFKKLGAAQTDINRAKRILGNS